MCSMKLGDLVRTVDGWGVIKYVGIVIGIEASLTHVNVLLQKQTTLGEKTHWFPIDKLEVIGAKG